jgi:hypothetical protein
MLEFPWTLRLVDADCPAADDVATKVVDWSPLASRKVVIWPDADLPGAVYADAAAAAMNKERAASIRIIDPPHGFAVVAKRPEPSKERQINWAPLGGRNVVVWPDKDDPCQSASKFDPRIASSANATLMALSVLTIRLEPTG